MAQAVKTISYWELKAHCTLRSRACCPSHVRQVSSAQAMHIRNWRLLPLALLLTLRAQAGDLYHIRQLSERALTDTYAAMLLDACHHADSVWQESTSDPAAGYWGSGRSDNMNEGVRAIAGMVLACGALVKYDTALSGADRQEYLRKATRAIRFAVSAHRTGQGHCTDGKPWGGSWQSAMWTATLGFGAWLIWDDLEPGLREGVERVVASEADRFLNVKPPSGLSGDTKAEENGWDMTCLALAPNMFAAHPHAAAWKQKAIEYLINTLSAPQDAQDRTVVDGRPISDWFSGANVQPDFTLENHNIFHPAYVGCSSYFLTQAAMYCTYGRQPIPQAVTHHLLDTWKMFQAIILPGGESAYPQGMDWELHGLSFINLYASLAGYQKDPLASRLENNCVQYLRAWQNMRKGDMAIPGSRLGFTRHAICAEQAAYAYLAHQVFGPPVKGLSARKAAQAARGVSQHEYVGFIADRTRSKLVSFSWKNRMMGMVIPIGPGHEANPHFTVPITTGLVGSFDLGTNREAKVKAAEHQWTRTPQGFETMGTLLLNGGLLKQTLRVTSLGERAVVYQDRVTALGDITMSRELGVPVGIENDEVTGGQRVVYDRDGQKTFKWKQSQPAVALSGNWVNVDGRLGVATAAGAGLEYQQASGYDPHTAVCADVLYASFQDSPRRFNAGDQVARRIVVFFTEVSPRKTAVLAEAVKIEERSQGRVLHLNLPEGGRADVPLL
jgi:hypothetical protein